MLIPLQTFSGPFHASGADLSIYDRDCMALYGLNIYRKGLLILGINS